MLVDTAYAAYSMNGKHIRQRVFTRAEKTGSHVTFRRNSTNEKNILGKRAQVAAQRRFARVRGKHTDVHNDLAISPQTPNLPRDTGGRMTGVRVGRGFVPP